MLILNFCQCSQCKSVVDCGIDVYVTLEHQWCCITLATIENIVTVISFCGGY